MYNKLKSFFQQGNRGNWCLFTLFAIILFFKVTLAHWYFFHSILFSSLWKDPLAFYVFWAAKLIVSIGLASFVFLFKRKGWIIVTLFCVDLWIIANIVYYKANGLFISFEVIQIIDNLKGFESSIFVYMNWSLIFFPLSTLIYIFFILLINLNYQQKSYLIFSYLIISVIVVGFSVCYSRYLIDKSKESTWNEIRLHHYIIPYNNLVHSAIKETFQLGDSEICTSDYIYSHSIITYFPALFIIYEVTQREWTRLLQQDNMTELIPQQMSSILHYSTNTIDIVPQYNMILVLVESLESWVFETIDDNGNQITPHTRKFIEQKSTLYCDKVISQVRDGVSGDGQMICNTGLLPLQRGAACVLFGNNIFPNWAHLYPASYTIIPTIGKVWNQTEVTYSYGYKSLCEPEPTEKWNDIDVVNKSLNLLDTLSKRPYCCQIVTISTHTPFTKHHCNDLYFSSDTPKDLKNYLHTIHYMDSCLSVIYDRIEQDSVWQNTTLILTGDHTIFKDILLNQYRPYAEKNNLSFKNGKNYCPLIVYSPSIDGNIRIEEECYQMDIYPTILSLIGAQDYYWKGFGVNLLDSTARRNRSISEQEAFILSDKLIRSNWFATYSEN